MSTQATELHRRISEAFPGPTAPASDRKRILVSAFTISPKRGSEPAGGWNVITRLAAFHDITVLTSSECEGEDYRNETLAHLEKNPVPGLRIHYVDPPMLARKLMVKSGQPLRPFYYFGYGAAVSEVVVDTLTGEFRLLEAELLHDAGASINPAIDLGQIEGAFIQGMGWLTTEQLVWDGQGRLATHAPSTYKIPATGDLPAHFHIDLWPEPNREDNVGGSKAVGEPPFMLAISVWEALRDAVSAARGGELAHLDAPATAENVLRALRG